MERCDQVLDFFATPVVLAPLRKLLAARNAFHLKAREGSGRRKEE
jgi:hypothetical protein